MVDTTKPADIDFSLFQLPKKLKAFSQIRQNCQKLLFPLVQLPKKLKG